VPEIHRLRGVFLRGLGFPAEEIERALRTAVQIAEEQGALLLKLRAATSLARLWRDQGKPQQAREMLAGDTSRVRIGGEDFFSDGFAAATATGG
jgi:hypothetical protein